MVGLLPSGQLGGSEFQKEHENVRCGWELHDGVPQDIYIPRRFSNAMVSMISNGRHLINVALRPRRDDAREASIRCGGFDLETTAQRRIEQLGSKDGDLDGSADLGGKRVHGRYSGKPPTELEPFTALRSSQWFYSSQTALKQIQSHSIRRNVSEMRCSTAKNPASH
jgi:hypothetical protein